MDISQIHGKFLECGGKLTTDSRKIEPACIFVALKGENFDGNAFAQSALDRGAAWCVVADGSEAASSGNPHFIPVPDTLRALQDLASYHREHTLHDGKRIKMLALTGTNGKTTTKELIKSVLSCKYRLTATEGNFNNNIGVPLTLLRMTEETQMAVIEMGASHPGDIKELVDIAHPDFGLITNVGRAHLLGFGSFEGVKATKGEMYDWIASSGEASFVNCSSADLVEMASLRPGMKLIPYGRDVQQATVLPQDAGHPFLRMKVKGECFDCQIDTRLVGAYNADNVLAALALGRYFGVDMPDAVRAIEAYEPSNKRSQMQKSERNVLIVDAYNANPSSMAAALDNFIVFNAERKAVMLGDMLELGAESQQEHLKVLRKLRDELGPETVVLVGKEFREADKTLGTSFNCFETSEEASAFLKANPVSGYAVLVKGSRGTKMENVLENL